jgi:hypothetical protein
MREHVARVTHMTEIRRLAWDYVGSTAQRDMLPGFYV